METTITLNLRVYEKIYNKFQSVVYFEHLKSHKILRICVYCFANMAPGVDIIHCFTPHADDLSCTRPNFYAKK